MFTGLVEELGTITASRSERGGRVLTVTADFAAEVRLGDSVAVDGVCLTAETLGRGNFQLFVSPETVARSTLDEVTPGRRVNLERALALGERLGGHLMQGHVDAVGQISDVRRSGAGAEIEIQAPAEVARYLVHKGSVAVDGISLTVARLAGERFTVAVIPHTLAATSLQDARVGRRVNLESDLIAKYVERLLADRGGEGVSRELLARQGFVR